MIWKTIGPYLLGKKKRISTDDIDSIDQYVDDQSIYHWIFLDFECQRLVLFQGSHTAGNFEGEILLHRSLILGKPQKNMNIYIYIYQNLHSDLLIFPGG